MGKEYARELLKKHVGEAINVLVVPGHHPTPEDVKRISEFTSELSSQSYDYAVLPYDQPTDAGYVNAIKMDDSRIKTVVIEYGDTTKLPEIMREQKASIETMGSIEIQAILKLMRKNNIVLAIRKGEKKIFVNTRQMQLFLNPPLGFPNDHSNEKNWRWLVESMVIMQFKVADIERNQDEWWPNVFPKDSVIREILH